jgi:RNA polymerase sigma-70 factor (ECF subfamily)
MLGSAFDADDAVQETFVRAWRAYHRFEGRSSLPTWLHRIASNVCFDMLNARRRRALPADPGGGMLAGLASDTAASALRPVAGAAPGASSDPADRAVERDDVRSALVAALLHLPPKQRSALLLCDVLRWRASETAELLGTTVPSVNSALQRARATLAELPAQRQRPAARRPATTTRDTAADAEGAADGADQQALVHRLADAFDRHDVTSLVALLR